MPVVFKRYFLLEQQPRTGRYPIPLVLLSWILLKDRNLFINLYLEETNSKYEVGEYWTFPHHIREESFLNVIKKIKKVKRPWKES